MFWTLYSALVFSITRLFLDCIDLHLKLLDPSNLFTVCLFRWFLPWYSLHHSSCAGASVESTISSGSFA